MNSFILMISTISISLCWWFQNLCLQTSTGLYIDILLFVCFWGIPNAMYFKLTSTHHFTPFPKQKFVPLSAYPTIHSFAQIELNSALNWILAQPLYSIISLSQKPNKSSVPWDLSCIISSFISICYNCILQICSPMLCLLLYPPGLEVCLANRKHLINIV